ncbi:MAG: HD-GYP domain-containing protein [Gammaproteobacteria bacterium]|nr:HD-GYP domain-containing protein [Gammaproteobacteria bacterium]
MEKKLSTSELRIGMYVSRVDRPWLDTPFMFQGFRIRNDHDIDNLRRYCRHVYVDETKVEEKAPEPLLTFGTLPLTDELKKIPGMPVERVAYGDVTSIEEELPRARDSKHALGDAVEALVRDIRIDKKIDAGAMKGAVDDMVQSVIRNPDALLWLTKLRSVDSYAYDHAIDTAVLAVMFGRHLGLSRDQLHDLGLAGLLFDVGKLKLPPDLLTKPGKLTDEEFTLVRRHVDFGVEILSQGSGVPPRVLDGVRHHHERHDGRGYPMGLMEGEIPIFARIIAIVDCFDAITSKRPFREPISAHHAIRQMYEWRDTEFQAQLYEQFIQCLGVYPTGTIVELSSGEIAIVVAQNRTRRLRPRVMLILDEEKVAFERNSVLDLGDELPGPGERPLEIVDSHDSGAFGIDPTRYFA